MAWLGDEPVEDIRRADLQALIDQLQGAPVTIEATIIPLRAIFRHELERDRIKINPTTGLKIPRGEKPRDRIADPVEAAALTTGPCGLRRCTRACVAASCGR